jgi:arsenite oxidase small subunit
MSEHADADPKRRKFIEICAVGAGVASACAGASACAQASASTAAASTANAKDRIKAGEPTPPPPKKSGVTLKPKDYARVQLVDVDGKPIRASSLKTNHNYVFNYPFEGTPCFLLRLDRAARAENELLTEKGDAYAWNGGVGKEQSIVAYSAICAHKLAYPTSQVSFISYRDKPPTTSKVARSDGTGQVIGCCADHSAYDPFRGARVLRGPAPQPLLAILLAHDAKTDHLFATGTLGGEMFDAFFQKYAFKLSLEKGGSRAQERSARTSVLRDLAAYSTQTAQC